MWSNDWPHDEGSYLESRETVERLLGHFLYATRKKLLHDNAAKLYKLDQASSSTAVGRDWSRIERGAVLAD